jgi:hypothetical protein
MLWTVIEMGVDAREASGDLEGDKGFTAVRAFMVKQNPIAGINTVDFVVIIRNPVGIELGNAVGRCSNRRVGFPYGGCAVPG